MQYGLMQDAIDYKILEHQQKGVMKEQLNREKNGMILTASIK